MLLRQALAAAAGLLLAVGHGATIRQGCAASPAERKLTLPDKAYRYTEPQLPANFEERWVKALDTTPSNNLTTDAGAALGRVLFYDTRMSASGTVSCGSCHRQEYAFAEPAAVSQGHEGRRGDRNAMSLINLRFSRAGFFWDERSETLEEAVGLPVRSRLEMAGPGGPAIVKVVASDRRYEPLFEAAFGSPQVTEERIRLALAQFIRAMVSCDSKYDRAASQAGNVKEDFAAFTAEENLGKTLFLQRCNLCHHIGEGQHVAFFDMFRSLNNGLDPDADASDGGRGDITLNPSEVGLFRASSLRNVAVTAPYMHDGRLATLEDVVEHYSSGTLRHPNAGAVGRFGFAALEKAALVAFLKTLTDDTFLEDARFSDPWTIAAGPKAGTDVAPAGVRSANTSTLQPATERIARGEGLRVGEASQWLKGLDANGDGLLNQAEMEPLIQVLVKTRVGVLSTERGGAAPGRVRGGRGRPEGATSEASEAQGDFDADGTVTEAEASALSAFQRLTDLGDGGPLRRLVRTDRFLGGYDLSAAEAEAARQALNAGRSELAEQVHALDLAALSNFEKLAGAGAVARFQTLVIDRQSAAVRVRTAREDDPRPTVERQLAQFDRDENGTYSAAEVAELGAALDRLAGGFGQAPPALIDMTQFHRRFVSYDPAGQGSVAIAKLPERLVDFAVRGDHNRDAVLSPEEIEDYIRATAFGHLLEEGVYVGGGFANTLDRYAELVDELGLAGETRDQVKQVFENHTAQVESLKRESIAAQFAKFRAAVGDRVPPLARR